MLQIIDYQPEWQSVFERMNRAWIEENFTLEEADAQVIMQPEKYILQPGGAILMAKKADDFVGTVSMQKVDDQTFEMIKLTVDKRFRGQGFGKSLCEAIMEKARELGATRMILYSNTTHAAPAIAMYRKYGFLELPLEPDSPYQRADIKMEIPLAPMSKADRQRLIASYGKAYDKIKAALAQYPREMWQWRPPSGKWTIHENIIHLADSEANSYARCRKFIVEPGSTVMAYDQEAWAKNLNYHEQSTEDALELFRLLRTMSYNLIKNLPDEVWEHTIEHPENGTMTFKDWLRIYENHTHIESMRRVFEAWQRVESRETDVNIMPESLYPLP